MAQAAATLTAMYPGRFWAALGTGEASNEHITGGGWPRKEVRNARLRECVDVMRALLAGEEVSHDGLVTVDRARLWTRPETPPPLIAAAVSPKTAAWAAEWADGLATVLQPHQALHEVIEAYRGAGGPGPLVLQVHLSYAAEDATALQIAHDQWRTNVFAPPVCWDLDHVALFDEAARHVPPEAMQGPVLVSSAPPSKLPSPVVEGGYAPEHVNAEAQRRDPDSLYAFVSMLIRRYRECPELGWGDFAILDQPQAQVLAHSVTWDEACLVHNLSAEPVTVPFRVSEAVPGTRLVDLLCDGVTPVADSGDVEIALPAYGFRWLRVVRPGDCRLT